MSGWNSKWSQNIDEILARKGHRASAVKIFNRIRSGSLPGWIGGPPTTGGANSSQSSQHPSPALKPRGSKDSNADTSEAATKSRDSRTDMASCPPDVGHLSSSESTSTGHTASTSQCIDLTTLSSKEYVVPTRKRRPDDEENSHEDHLLKPHSPEDLLFPPEISFDSSPLTPRKEKFTIVPCSKEDPLDPKMSKRRGNAALGLIVSALYGKLLVVMGIAFPMAEVISTYIPPSFYDGFYLYLYFGSITFMICIYGNILRQKATKSVRCTLQRFHTMRSRLTAAQGNVGGNVAPDVTPTDPPDEVSSDSEGFESGSHPDYDVNSGLRIHFGSFYLRMGAVAFGIGSMIYSGLEFGQYFELDPDTKCHNFMIALTPAVRMIFTFMQMYFIFLNSKMAVYKLQLGAQFGLMHMIGTNLCVWLNVLVQETRHEILMFYNPDNGTITYPSINHHSFGLRSHGAHSHSAHGYGHSYYHSTTPTPHIPLTSTHSPTIMTPTVTSESVLNITSTVSSAFNSTITSTVASVLEAHHRSKRGLKGPYSMYECRRSDIMGALVQNASPFLFPCTIEYSLICAAILYVMWKSMATSMSTKRTKDGLYYNGDLTMYPGHKRSPHHYSVDCARANKGLFLGIFVLVMTIISLILFFVLITRPGYQSLAVLEVNITELVLYTMTTVAVLVGMCQMRELKYVRGRNLELDNILLIVAQTGSFIYNVFTIIGGQFTMKKNTSLVLITALSSLIQLLFQTLFILDASKRSAANADQQRRKPGREVVTFLLVTNLAMWAINTLEKSRADSHPVQLKFYGVWAWTIITHISMPLAIFYRFHSTVCLCEIWKRAYKIKPTVYR